MNNLIIFGIIVQIFISIIFYNGLREKRKNGESITFEIILLGGMYIPVIIMLTSYLIK